MPLPSKRPYSGALHSENVLLGDGGTIEVALWAESGGNLRYRLRYGRDGAWLVEYDNESGRDRRRMEERVTRYEFRSVEQMRYDFEHDREELSDGDEAQA